MRFPAPEPAAPKAGIAKTAVLLVNLGTPDAPTPAAVRRYLRQFLSDPRVVEIPRAVWLPLLYGFVLATRPRQSARKYASIWSPEGSPLRVHTQKQARLLGERLGPRIRVEFAMRYGEPSIPTTLARLKAEGHGRVLLLPLYPQYAASTTASALDHAAEFLRGARDVPEIRLVKEFHDHPAYIGALAALVREYWAHSGRPDRLLISFHGLPQYTVERGDPYSRQCHTTAGLLAERLGLAQGEWQTTFQSRFGRTAWLEPYTAATLAECGRRGIGHVHVVCPGFVADCLETLEEIGIESRKIFLEAGGREFHLLPCLNERADWIGALATIAGRHLSGWTDTEALEIPRDNPS